jgi:hypothetical protein
LRAQLDTALMIVVVVAVVVVVVVVIILIVIFIIIISLLLLIPRNDLPEFLEFTVSIFSECVYNMNDWLEVCFEFILRAFLRFIHLF